MQTKIQAPLAKLVPKEMVVHGDVRVDNYFWMRDRSDPDVLAYLEAENHYMEELMEPTKDLQHRLYDEILARIKETDLSVPIKRDDYYYYSRTEQGKAYSTYCRRRGPEGPEEILLDTNILAEGQKYFRIGDFSVSPNHLLLAYSTDVEGDETYTIRIKDLVTGALLPDEMRNAYYTLEWANDNRTLFYTTLDPARRPYQVFRHELGVAADALVYQEDDARFSLGLTKSRSNRFLFIGLASPLTSEFRYLDAGQPDEAFRVLFPRQQGTEYDASHQMTPGGDYFYIRTNEGAQNFRLMRTPVADPSKKNWEEIIPPREGVTIESIDPFENYLVVYERHRGLEKIRVTEHTGEIHYVEFPEPVYTFSPGPNAEYNTKLLRFTYTSLVTPRSVFDYDMETRGRELKKQYEVLGGYDASLYRSERILAKAPDGVEIPISLVYRNTTARDGAAPLLLYGYGSYGISIDPSFSSDRLSLLDRGWIYAIAHIRGGGDLGKYWHEDGKLLKKKNTFVDFIASAEHLVAHSYTKPDRMAIMGGSAGGLLMGAAINLRPDLFHAVVAHVPFVDTLNTGLDPTLPLTVGEYEEWGNPEDKLFYDYIKSYAPYENVEPKAYPAMLVTTGLNDPRVSYWEPAKWTAKLRALKSDEHVILLKTNMGAGHFGPSGRYERIKEIAFDYAFLLSHSQAGG